MLSLFPELLTFGIFGALFIRLAVGIFFFLLGWQHLKKERESLKKEYSQRFGVLAGYFTWAVATVEIVLGLALIAGFLTQGAAVLAIVLSAKALWFKKEFPVFAPYEKIVYVLLIVMSLSLLLTGAGVPAIDFPL